MGLISNKDQDADSIRDAIEIWAYSIFGSRFREALEQVLEQNETAKNNLQEFSPIDKSLATTLLLQVADKHGANELWIFWECIRALHPTMGKAFQLSILQPFANELRKRRMTAHLIEFIARVISESGYEESAKIKSQLSNRRANRSQKNRFEWTEKPSRITNRKEGELKTFQMSSNDDVLDQSEYCLPDCAHIAVMAIADRVSLIPSESHLFLNFLSYTVLPRQTRFRYRTETLATIDKYITQSMYPEYLLEMLRLSQPLSTAYATKYIKALMTSSRVSQPLATMCVDIFQSAMLRFGKDTGEHFNPDVYPELLQATRFKSINADFLLDKISQMMMRSKSGDLPSSTRHRFISALVRRGKLDRAFQEFEVFYKSRDPEKPGDSAIKGHDAKVYYSFFNALKYQNAARQAKTGESSLNSTEMLDLFRKDKVPITDSLLTDYLHSISLTSSVEELVISYISIFGMYPLRELELTDLLDVHEVFENTKIAEIMGTGDRTKARNSHVAVNKALDLLASTAQHNMRPSLVTLTVLLTKFVRATTTLQDLQHLRSSYNSFWAALSKLPDSDINALIRGGELPLERKLFRKRMRTLFSRQQIYLSKLVSRRTRKLSKYPTYQPSTSISIWE